MSEQQSTYRIASDLEHFKNALPAALMYLAKGERPKSIPEGTPKGMRLTITPQAEGYIEKLLPEFGSRTRVITNALAWVAERSDREQLMLLNTKI